MWGPLGISLADLSPIHSEDFLGALDWGSVNVSPFLFKTKVSEMHCAAITDLCSYAFVCLHGYVHVCSRVFCMFIGACVYV